MSLSLYPNMMQRSLARRVKDAEAERAERLANIKSKKAAQAYCTGVRRKMRRIFGPMPPRSRPDVRVTGSTEYQGYTLERVLYESRPGFWVSAARYVPTGPGPFPAVLGSCGHAANGKADVNYQAYGQKLARLGYMVLVTDPVSQGERVQFTDATEGKPFPNGNCCDEHNLINTSQRLVGQWLGQWILWDQLVGINVLWYDPRVDRNHLGVTGNSGGGTLSSFVNAVESRVTMAAPSCYITTLARNIRNSLPTDAEQNPPGFLAAGLDMGDFILASAPRPSLLLGQDLDFFDTRGLEQTYAEVKRIYDLLGCGDDVETFIGPRGHGYFVENREAMYNFFNRYVGKPTNAREGKALTPTTNPDETLQATETGNVRTDAVDSLRICDFTRETAHALAEKRNDVSAARLRKLLPDLLALPERKGVCDWNTTGMARWRYNGRPRRKLPYQLQYTIETEPDIYAVINRCFEDFGEGQWAFRPPVSMQLFVPHIDSEDDINEIRSEVCGVKTTDAWFVEPRGIGESIGRSPEFQGFCRIYGEDFFHASVHELLGENLAGRRVHDVLATIDVLEDLGVKKIELIGRGLGAITAGFAALLHPCVKKVRLHNAPLSFEEVAESPLQRWPLSAVVPGILEHCDLPDVYRALGKKELQLTRPWTPQWKRYTPAQLSRQRSRLNLKGIKIVR